MEAQHSPKPCEARPPIGGPPPTPHPAAVCLARTAAGGPEPRGAAHHQTAETHAHHQEGTWGGGTRAHNTAVACWLYVSVCVRVCVGGLGAGYAGLHPACTAYLLYPNNHLICLRNSPPSQVRPLVAAAACCCWHVAHALAQAAARCRQGIPSISPCHHPLPAPLSHLSASMACSTCRSTSQPLQASSASCTPAAQQNHNQHGPREGCSL